MARLVMLEIRVLKDLMDLLDHVELREMLDLR